MNEDRLRIHLLGTSFTVKTNEDPEYFHSLVRYVERKHEEVRQSMGVTDPLRIAVLSSILITDELRKADKGTDQAEDLTADLIKLIDQSLEE
jgi:cell division protein ZapA (FtsZ GTPase activity inhibitor)